MRLYASSSISERCVAIAWTKTIGGQGNTAGLPDIMLLIGKNRTTAVTAVGVQSEMYSPVFRRVGARRHCRPYAIRPRDRDLESRPKPRLHGSSPRHGLSPMTRALRSQNLLGTSPLTLLPIHHCDELACSPWGISGTSVFGGRDRSFLRPRPSSQMQPVHSYSRRTSLVDAPSRWRRTAIGACSIDSTSVTTASGRSAREVIMPRTWGMAGRTGGMPMRNVTSR